MFILGIESSCDETAASVVEACPDGRLRILSNIIASQIDLHSRYGGVVPEIASRAHTEAISRITYDALECAGITTDKLDAVGVTYTPGLIGALLVGVNFAKALALSNNIPLVGVNHIKAHAAANWLVPVKPGSPVEMRMQTELEYIPPALSEKSPALAFIASGGHTSILELHSPVDYKTIGHTRDDAMGEAFDKIGRVLGLPYPGGEALDRLAADFYVSGVQPSFKLPSAAIDDGTLDFSFSGIKTSVLDRVNSLRQKGQEPDHAEFAAALTTSIVSSVIRKLDIALDRTSADILLAAGGATANSHLRSGLIQLTQRRGIELYIPPLWLCGDNGAMVAAQAYFELLNGNFSDASLNGTATGTSEL